jgi:hypothetical protein
MVLSGVLWFGIYLSRLTLSYQLFKGQTFSANDYISKANLPGILLTLNNFLLLSAICFLIFIITLILFLIFSKISLKENGWLFISTIIVLITMPFEVYLMSIDYKIYNIVNSTGYNPFDVLTLYAKRLSLFGSFPIIELLCYCSIIFFILFQPFKKNRIK